MTIKKTLLQIVQSILSDMDSEDVNSISDTVEAMQVASIVEDTFYNLVATRTIPEHHELIKLTALSDTDYPTHFQYPDNVKGITKVWYDVSDDGTFEYREISWVDNETFLRRVDGRATDSSTNVSDKNGGTNLRIYNDRHPSFYTSFDDDYLVFDAHKSTVDTTLQAGKVRAMGYVIPTFSRTDGYTPDIDEEFHPYLLAEAKSTAMSLLKGGPDPKIDQAARRQKAYIQNDKHKTNTGNKRPQYGRR